ncbi:MAG: KEOPS complex subunit Cgi121 [Nitrososphaera sp.]|jgi:tRNA threonylcarbamoyladenosine modification (KEOPS) complex Cgi121 subunit/molybdopterin converting factor small subunit
MITVKLLGGSKKSFSSDILDLQIESITISDLIKYLQSIILNGQPALDVDNILIAVNGIDSSALEGKDTLIKGGDVVSIIPLIHGGSFTKTQFRIFKTNVLLIGVKKSNLDLIGILDKLRKQYPKLVIQIIRANIALNTNHVKKVLRISLTAKSTDTMLSDTLASDILLRFACTRQITDAIKKAGIQANKDSLLIIMGKKSEIKKIEDAIRDLPRINISSHNSKIIKRQFGITKKELDSVMSKNKLEDLLAERSALLFR